MTLANLITLFRLICVPVIVWALLTDAILAAFILFLVAGLSDAIDGLVARYFNQQSELGTVLDPVADKVMLVAVFVVLALLGHVPLWLVILIVSRDILIVSGIGLASYMQKPVQIRPIWVSKATTAAQICLVLLVMGAAAFSWHVPDTKLVLEWVVGGLTAVSAIAYMIQGVRHLADQA